MLLVVTPKPICANLTKVFNIKNGKEKEMPKFFINFAANTAEARRTLSAALPKPGITNSKTNTYKQPNIQFQNYD